MTCGDEWWATNDHHSCHEDQAGSLVEGGGEGTGVVCANHIHGRMNHSGQSSGHEHEGVGVGGHRDLLVDAYY